MRSQNTRPALFWVGILALTVLLTGLAVGSVNLQAEAPRSPSPTATPAATPSPERSLLSDARGFISLEGDSSPPRLRRETNATPLVGLRGQGYRGAVSGTGRRVAYWVSRSGTAGGTREIRVMDVAARDEGTQLHAVADTERGAGIQWSTDRSGLLLVVESSIPTGVGETPGAFSALRLLDVPTRSVREVARLSEASRFWPVGWDRGRAIAGACIALPDGTAIAYAVVGEDARSTRTPMDPGIPARTVQSSGRSVLAVMNEAVIRLWDLASYDEHRELGAALGERIGFARWGPSGTEIVVAVADRLEVWPAQGGERRVVARSLPAATDLLVSADGALAFITFDGGRNAVAVELASGRLAPVPVSGDRLVATVSLD